LLRRLRYYGILLRESDGYRYKSIRD
jgi:hypothetical protein